MQGSGEIANQVFNETWMPSSDGGYDITGMVGSSTEQLHAHADTQYWYLDGSVGNVSVHEKGAVVMGPTAAENRYVLDGTLGDEPYHTELYKLPNGLSSDGYLSTTGDAANISASPSTDGNTIFLTGGGASAGIPYSLQGSISVTQPPPPTPPPSAAAPPSTPSSTSGS